MNVKNMLGQKILLISPHFYDYEDAIKGKIESLGGTAYYIDERPGNDTFTKGIIRINPSVIDYAISRYYDGEINKIPYDGIDKLLVISPEAINEKIMQMLHNRFSKAKYILYMWDSVHNKTGRDNTRIFKYFDKIYTFDINDSNTYPNMTFRALFYRDELVCDPNTEFKYDLLFIGSMHSDRYEICKKVKNIFMSKEANVFFYMYIQNKKVFFYQKISNRSYKDAVISEFKYKPLPYHGVVNLIKESKIVLDIQHPKQSGLTMRTIESIGARKKLISTNQSIKTYDFYNENNICIIDRNNIKISDDFMYSIYKPYDVSIYDNYSINKWLMDLLS